MTKILFDCVQLTQTFIWKENGKRKQKTVKFEQTINPFNKNKSGITKTRKEITVELQELCDKWYAACERAGRGLESNEL